MRGTRQLAPQILRRLTATSTYIERDIESNQVKSVTNPVPPGMPKGIDANLGPAKGRGAAGDTGTGTLSEARADRSRLLRPDLV